jgi:hypothetical protein
MTYFINIFFLFFYADVEAGHIVPVLFICVFCGVTFLLINVHKLGVIAILLIDTLSTINPFKAHSPPLTHGVLTY